MGSSVQYFEKLWNEELSVLNFVKCLKSFDLQNTYSTQYVKESYRLYLTGQYFRKLWKKELNFLAFVECL